MMQNTENNRNESTPTTQKSASMAPEQPDASDFQNLIASMLDVDENESMRMIDRAMKA